ncbi:hypothetical protein HYH03_019018 [Edaphochlamys debaryana]|uniref:Bulb-type lectin domain-containing protein n=1 Tax=Edaphochlamys debaryana TaxID=47281 RepID=A0A835XKM7_9CHLO|nr:hypothetical protein HYH03_019018 [Edaphochlamys debaryana]|eukprot:KAG2482029.1 hypothetical protein HYH03_019018 [Edaphochlamys debaryana]
MISSNLSLSVGQSFAYPGNAGPSQAPFVLRLYTDSVTLPGSSQAQQLPRMVVTNRLGLPAWSATDLGTTSIQTQNSSACSPGAALNAAAGCVLRCGLYQPSPGGTGQDGFCNTIRSPSQRISFMLQASDGNLVLADRERGKTYWASSSGIKNATDHVLYLTANGTKQRSFPMNGGPDNGPYTMVVHDEGGWAEIVNVYGIPTWWTIPECPLRLEANQTCSPARSAGCSSHCGLYQGLSGSQEDGCNYWWSPTRTHALVLRGDGVLGLFRANGSSGGLFLGSPLWAAGTSLSGATNASFVLEPNGTWTLRGAGGTGVPYGVRATSAGTATVGGSLSFPENAGVALGPFSLHVLDTGALELRNGEGGVAWKTVPSTVSPSPKPPSPVTTPRPPSPKPLSPPKATVPGDHNSSSQPQATVPGDHTFSSQPSNRKSTVSISRPIPRASTTTYDAYFIPGVDLYSGELLTSVLVRTANAGPVARLEFSSNMRSSITVGSARPLQVTSEYRVWPLLDPVRPAACLQGDKRLVAAVSRGDGYLNSISFVWGWRLDALTSSAAAATLSSPAAAALAPSAAAATLSSPTAAALTPSAAARTPFNNYGSVAVGAWNDTNLAAGGLNPVTRIRWYAGWWIDCIQFTYGSTPGPWHGCNDADGSGGATQFSVDLYSGELLTSVLVRTANAGPVARLEFSSNMRSSITVGSARPLQVTSEYRVWPLLDPVRPAACLQGDKRLVAAVSRGDGYLNSISFVWGWRLDALTSSAAAATLSSPTAAALAPSAAATPLSGPATAALTSSAAAATLSIPATAALTPSAAAATLSSPTAAALTPSAAATPLSIPATAALTPSVAAATLSIPATAALTPSAAAATLSIPATAALTPSAAAATLSIPATAALTPSAAAATLSIPATAALTPSAAAATLSIPATAALTQSAAAATLSSPTAAALTPSAAAATLSIPATAALTPSAAAATLSIPATAALTPSAAAHSTHSASTE